MKKTNKNKELYTLFFRVLKKTEYIWQAHRQPAMRLEPHRLHFIDETSVDTKMVRAYGWGVKAERLVGDAPFGHWLTQTFIAALRCDGLCAPWVLNHPMCRESFDVYIETQLAPILKSGDIVILDNRIRGGHGCYFYRHTVLTLTR